MNRKIILLIFCAIFIGSADLLTCKYSKIGFKCFQSDSYKSDIQEQEFQPKNLPQVSNDQVTAVSATSDANLTHLTSKICETFPNALEIDVRNTKVEFLDENSFENCKNLAFLMLSDNEIKEVPEKLFDMNSNLEMLLMRNILISSVPQNFLKTQRKSLKILHITSKSSYKVPESFFNLFENLEDLWIGKVENFNFNWIKNLKNLKTLSITNCKIDKIPENTFNILKNLENLNLSENKLQTVCAESFGNLPNLRNIDFSFNKITAIEEALIDNTGVVSMDMTGNVCANSKIEDNNKENLKKMIKICFDNFNGCQ
jgi:Leucine-rich repeat (LRR) protein